jgi:hypothetical protein
MTLYYSYWIIIIFHVASFQGLGLFKLLGIITIIGTGSALISLLLLLMLPVTYAILLNGVIVGLGVIVYLYNQFSLLKLAA